MINKISGKLASLTSLFLSDILRSNRMKMFSRKRKFILASNIFEIPRGHEKNLSTVKNIHKVYLSKKQTFFVVNNRKIFLKHLNGQDFIDKT